jgi:peroxiredoxin
MPVRQTISVSLALALSVLAQRGLHAQSDGASADPVNGPLPGHSYHGEVFNEGPRQKAYLMGGTGTVFFPVSTRSPEAQEFFLQGLGQLHGFWYFESERSFRQAATLDPDCAMAYWGMAMSNLDNRERGKKFIAEAERRMDSATRKEQQWIEAVADYLSDEGDEIGRRRKFVEALEALVREFPDDLEPKAFLAVQIWKNDGSGIPISSRQTLESLIQEVLRVEPMHPIHHYRIHNWDGGEAAVALTSAALCGQSAPSIAHMWHMPGHIYSKVHRYADAAWQQEASARVDHAQMIRDRVLPDQIRNYAHNNEWLIRNLSHLGRVREAIDLARNMIELPRHPKYNMLNQERGSSAKYGRQRLIEVLVRWELWEELLALSETVYLEPTDILAEQARRLRAMGIAAFGSGKVDRGKQAISQLAALSLDEREKRQSDIDRAESKTREENKEKDEEELKKKVDQARADAERKADEDRQQIDSALEELRGLECLAAGDQLAARDYFVRLSGVSKERHAVYMLRAGDEEQAEKLAREAADTSRNEVQPLASYVEILERLGRTEQAASVFGKLRGVAAHAELDLPVLARLKPVAERLELPADWRNPPEPNGDVGKRPELDHLGPFRWRPVPATPWQLADADGHPLSVADYRGRPLIVIFYLGFGCLHCEEQLQAFAAMAEDFHRAGLDLVAISTESPQHLKEGLANYSQDGRFPIRLLSDENMTVFKAYGAFDDFENSPLHGTFLIDRAGMVRWQDISYEPFNEPRFLISEATRLLDQSLDQVPSERRARVDSPHAAEARIVVDDAVDVVKDPAGAL